MLENWYSSKKIRQIFYGASKNKKGKDISDFEAKFIPNYDKIREDDIKKN